MNRTVLVLMLALSCVGSAQEKPPTTLKGVLLEQLRNTHDKQDWFATADTALGGLTPGQASWKDEHGNHSIGQLAAHLVFWNKDQLARFKGEPPPPYSGKNDDTFGFDAARWTETVRQLDEVMSAWEHAVEGADEAKLQQWASAIAHIGTHNAYHIGQIVYIRREQGSWDPEKGVK